jgi:hypothetical protein
MLLLAVVLSVVVVDGNGQPLDGATVGHTEKRFNVRRSGKDGRIAVETDATRIVIRKEGFQSAAVRPSEMKAGGRVVLQGSGRVAVCVASFPAPGWEAQPVRSGTRVQRFGGVLHGTGTMWGALVPSTKRVWESDTYSEREMLLNGRRSVDARGVMADGRHWREMGNFGETISYADVSAATAAELDKAIEGLCRARFSALVVDAEGMPLEGVVVTGRAATGLRIAFRKTGFRAAVVAPALGLVVTMQPADRPPFPRCKERRETTFQLPGAGEGAAFRDVDYNGRAYMVKTSSGKHYLQHGHGPMWSSGVPPGRYLEMSASYEESTYEGGANITAARGVFADGTRWRFLGTFGETISYETKDGEAARRFDLMMDGVCLGR